MKQCHGVLYVTLTGALNQSVHPNLVWTAPRPRDSGIKSKSAVYCYEHMFTRKGYMVPLITGLQTIDESRTPMSLGFVAIELP
jgi:hypothetical protein